MQSNRSNPHHDVGRRLYAAVVSAEYQMGMDHALKHYVPEDIDEAWGDLGALLQEALNKNIIPQMIARNRANQTAAQKGS